MSWLGHLFDRKHNEQTGAEAAAGDGQAASSTRFTSAGKIPPVSHDTGGSAAPTASERAYGHHHKPAASGGSTTDDALRVAGAFVPAERASDPTPIANFDPATGMTHWTYV